MAKAKVEEKKVNKSKLVAEAMDVLGNDAGPKAIMEHIKTNHGIEINYGMVASYKSHIKGKRGAGNARRGPGAGSVDVRDVIVVKELIERLGEPQLQGLIKVLKK